MTKSIVWRNIMKQIVLIFVLAGSYILGYRAISAILLIIILSDYFYAIIMYNKSQNNLKALTTTIDTILDKKVYNYINPVILIDDNGLVIWANNIFDKIIGKEYLHIEIDKLFFELKKEYIFNEDNNLVNKIKIEKKVYSISVKNILEGDKSYALIFFNDINELINTTGFREGIMLIEVDNIQEALETTEEGFRPLVIAEVDRSINFYANRLNAMVTKYENNKYVLSVQQKYLNKEIENKFRILDEVSKIDRGNKLDITLSIGVGMGGISPLENHSFATVAKELALGRGGDQAVVKKNEELKFFGGNTKEIEKRTRVRARVVAHALKELIYESNNVFIIGHTNPDMDCFGAAVALASTVRQFGKEVKIILDNDTNAIQYFLNNIRNTYDNMVVSSEEAKREIGEDSLLIIVDVHNKGYVSNYSIVEKVQRKVIIDHHRRSPDIIEGALLNYIEVYASSTSEMVTEIIQYMMERPKLPVLEAEGLLAGISMDTKSFSIKAGARTFEAASFLRKQGADTMEVKKMFADDLDNYLLIAETIKTVKVEDSIAIAIAPQEVDTVIIAKSADELLNINGIQASFVIGKIGKDIYISGRAIGDFNVQVILEALGGGGHLNMAGAKVTNSSIDEVIIKLKEEIAKKIRVGE